MRGVRMLRVAAAVAFIWLVAPAGARASSPCHEWAFTSPSRSVFHAVHIPVRLPTTSVAGYDADVLRPVKAPKGVRLPGVVLLHGRGGTKCGLWWAARLLAGRGYETLVLTYPSSGTPAQVEPGGASAARAALAWLRSSSNPYRPELRANDLALMGHSLGAIVAQDVQQDASLPYIKTIVALDNLRKYLIGDPGGAVSCDPSTLAGPITPRVPALGLGSLTGCPPPDQAITDKSTGYKNWRAAGVFVEEAVLAHSNHNGYADGPPFDAAHRAQLRHAAYYVLAWLARWLRGDTTQEARLVSQTPFGIPVTAMLADDASAPAFTSSAFLPSKECPVLRACP